MAIKNMRDRGAGVNPAADTGIINAAIQEAVAEGGGTVYFPAGVYHVRESLVVNGHSVHLRGDPSGSVLVSAGGFDTISVNQSSPEQYDNSIENLHLREQAKTGGRAIVAQRVARFQISGVILERPFDGIHVHNFNTVRIDRTRVAAPRGTFGCLLTGGGPSDPGRSDVIDFYDAVFEGDPQAPVLPTGPTPDRHGLIIDGAVNTVSAHKIYFIHIEGAALWIRNSLHDRNPEFATIVGLEAEFMRYEGIRIECGQRFYFTDALVHGSRQRSNIVVLDRVNTTAFHGGCSTGAHLAGIDIFGRRIGVCGMDVLANSRIQSGAWAGIVLEKQSRMVTITGNRCGDPDNRRGDPDNRTQSYGIQINSEADQFAVTGNVLFNNLNRGVLNGAGTGSSRIVRNNATEPRPT